jgi:hypothetical protein
MYRTQTALTTYMFLCAHHHQAINTSSLFNHFTAQKFDHINAKLLQKLLATFIVSFVNISQMVLSYEM